jgi:hypothetical protein
MTNEELGQDFPVMVPRMVADVNQIDHIFPKKMISDIKFWLNENIDCFEKISEMEKIKMMDDLAQLKLTIYMVEQWFESQIGSEVKLNDNREKESKLTQLIAT